MVRRTHLIMKMPIAFSVFFTVISLWCESPALSLRSPDGTVVVRVASRGEGLFYELVWNRETIIESSPLAGINGDAPFSLQGLDFSFLKEGSWEMTLMTSPTPDSFQRSVKCIKAANGGFSVDLASGDGFVAMLVPVE